MGITSFFDQTVNISENNVKQSVFLMENQRAVTCEGGTGLLILLILIANRDISVGIETRLRAGRPRKQDSIPGMCKRFISFP
jgi:hypothetical protein